MEKDLEQAFLKENANSQSVRYDYTLLTEGDIYLFNEGNHFRLYEKLGAHVVKEEARTEGTHFAVWAPNAVQLSVMGDFNGWDKTSHFLRPRGQSGIWEGAVPGLKKGDLYKYHILSNQNNYQVDKADPFAFFNQIAPEKASVVWDLHYLWQDQEWMALRERQNVFEAPMIIYELHPGSWRHVPEEDDRSLSYRELAPQLTDYVQRMGFSHVEFLPVMEHPFYGSWGYQTLGYFSPTSRYGNPQDFMYLID
jgi:1,4-alpha-glucan branching enzyme